MYSGALGIKFETLERPLSIESVRDGGGYILDSAPLSQTNLFLKVGRMDGLFIKLPTPRGLRDYRRFVRLAQPNAEDLRPR